MAIRGKGGYLLEPGTSFPLPGLPLGVDRAGMAFQAAPVCARLDACGLKLLHRGFGFSLRLQSSVQAGCYLDVDEPLGSLIGAGV